MKDESGQTRFHSAALSDIAPAEWLRPWKLASFAIGMGWLIWGALTQNIPDWDSGVSILMGGFTYLLAPWSARILLHRRWRMLPIALLAWWWCVDGVYMAWHSVVGNQTFRDANFYASSCLYCRCAFKTDHLCALNFDQGLLPFVMWRHVDKCSVFLVRYLLGSK